LQYNTTYAVCVLDTSGYRHTFRVCNTCWFFHGNYGYAKAPLCYVKRTLPVVFIFVCTGFLKLHSPTKFRALHIHTKRLTLLIIKQTQSTPEQLSLVLNISRNRTSIPGKNKYFSHFQATKTALCSAQSHIQWGSGLLSLGIRRPSVNLTIHFYLLIKWRMCGVIFLYITINCHIRLKQVWKVMEQCPWNFAISRVVKNFSLVLQSDFFCSFTKSHPVIFPYIGPGDAIVLYHNLSLLILLSVLCRATSIFALDFPTQILKYSLFFVFSFHVYYVLCQFCPFSVEYAHNMRKLQIKFQ
jgi:hypothetical protein